MSKGATAASSAARSRTDGRASKPGHRGADVERAGRAALMLAALGVVFGDIGTSPLYAIQTVFGIDNGAVRPTPADVYGVISLVFGSITVVVSVKYLTFIMRADNDGEGGIMALAALVRRVRETVPSGARRSWPSACSARRCSTATA